MADAFYRAEDGVASGNKSVDELNGLFNPTVMMKHLRIGLFSYGLQAVNGIGTTTKIKNLSRRQVELAGFSPRTAITTSGEACTTCVPLKLLQPALKLGVLGLHIPGALPRGNQSALAGEQQSRGPTCSARAPVRCCRIRLLLTARGQQVGFEGRNLSITPPDSAFLTVGLAQEPIFQLFQAGAQVRGLKGGLMGCAAKNVTQHVDFAEGTFSQIRGHVSVGEQRPVCPGYLSGFICAFPKGDELGFLGQPPDPAYHATESALQLLLDDARYLAVLGGFSDKVSVNVVVSGPWLDFKVKLASQFQDFRLGQAGADDRALKVAWNLPDCPTPLAVGRSWFLIVAVTGGFFTTVGPCQD